MSKSLLVVDDSATFRQLLCLSLSRIDSIREAKITEAEDGQEALEKLRTADFDMVFTDIRMPKMDGLELVRQIRGDLNRSNLPVIIISTKGSEQDVEMGMNLGASGYLSKPISGARLRELVQQFLV